MFGLAKYRTPLQAGNGRKHLEDALDEITDLAVYLQTELDERALIARKAWDEGYQQALEDVIAKYDEAAKLGGPTPGESIYAHPFRENPYADPYEGES